MADLLPLLRDYISFASENAMTVGICSGLTLVWIWSGCYSASIGEVRLRNPWVHFALGLTAPVIYPLIILFTLPVYTPTVESEEVAAAAVARADGAPPVGTVKASQDSAPMAPAMVDTNMIESTDIGYNDKYFRQIMIDAAGNERGPFEFIIRGDKMKVERIVEPLPTNVLIEFISSDGKLQKIRVPYKNIDSCNEL